MAENPGQFNTNPSIAHTSQSPTAGQLYVSVNELNSLYGIVATEGQIRYAQDIIHLHCNRKSFFPVEYEERIFISEGRTQSQLAYRPIVSILAAGGRYTPGRRNNHFTGTYGFGIPIFLLNSFPEFSVINIDTIEFDSATGMIFLPSTIYLNTYNEYQIKYLSGYIDIPGVLKTILVNIINNVCTMGSSNRIVRSVGGIHSEFQKASFISEMDANFLEPFVVKILT